MQSLQRGPNPRKPGFQWRSGLGLDQLCGLKVWGRLGILERTNLSKQRIPSAWCQSTNGSKGRLWCLSIISVHWVEATDLQAWSNTKGNIRSCSFKTKSHKGCLPPPASLNMDLGVLSKETENINIGNRQDYYDVYLQ